MDSQGGFSLNPEIAREKLRVFQESLPSYALLRIVQGLHQLQATEIRVTIWRKQLEIAAQCDGVLLAEVRSAFLGEAGLSASGAGSIAAGVNAATLTKGGQVRLSVGSQVWELEQDVISEQGSKVSFRFSQTLVGSFLGTVSLRARLQKQIEDRCRYSPCPFILDGRLLTPDWPMYTNSEDETTTIAPQLEWLESGSGFSFTVGDLEPYEYRDGLHVWAQVKPEPLRRYRSGFMPTVIYGGLEAGFDSEVIGCRTVISKFEGDWTRPCQVTTLCHSVVGEWFEVADWLPNSRVLMDVSELDMDLSGLKVARNAKYDLRAEEVRQLNHRAARALLKHSAEAARPHLKAAVPAYLARKSTWSGRFWRKTTSGLFSVLGSTVFAERRIREMQSKVQRWLDSDRSPGETEQ